MSSHPYRQQPARAFWNRSVTKTSWYNVEFAAATPRFLGPGTRIGTAGSCFASNLMRWLPSLGLTPFFTESPPSYFSVEEIRAHAYQEFSARYGNMYSVRQFRQLIEQALGLRPIIEEFVEVDSAVFDLLRPHVRPGGFQSIAEARADRQYHLACVERLLRECESFVFTLGLTEAWVNAESGTVYPVCPGTAVGRFDSAAHKPVNFDYPAILEDMEAVIAMVARVNPSMRWIITVSPVHLVATHTDESVIVASTYSKSVLRAVCGQLAQSHDHLWYFPSYEIISATPSFGQYLESNLRDASERGIAHVMKEFKHAFVGAQDGAAGTTLTPAPEAEADFFGQVELHLAGECDELKNQPAPG